MFERMNRRIVVATELWVAFITLAVCGVIATVNPGGIFSTILIASNVAIEATTGQYGSNTLVTDQTIVLDFAIASVLVFATLIATNRLAWKWLLSASFVAGLIGLLWGIGVGIFADIRVNPFVSGGLTVLTLLTACIARVVQQEKSARQLRSVLNNSISTQTLNHLSYYPEGVPFKGEARKITMLVAQIRNVQPFIDVHIDKPETITQILSTVSQSLIDEVKQGEGTVDKFLRSGVTAFWNAPLRTEDHEWAACECAQKLVARMDSINEEIEIIVGQNTQNAITNSYALLEVDRINTKSDQLPQRAYALLGNPVTKASPTFKSMVDTHSEFFQAYDAQNWGLAKTVLEKCVEISGAHPDLYRLYAERLSLLEACPPGEAWNGAYRYLTH